MKNNLITFLCFYYRYRDSVLTRHGTNAGDDSPVGHCLGHRLRVLWTHDEGSYWMGHIPHTDHRTVWNDFW